ncbi:glycosyltransferase family 2 protein [Flavobacterium columnare]|uniref:Glycosyltransferase n=2 Tax=Flavobacterium TaxID=237 RepID=A0A2N9PDX0_9FLAO|nr:glycosyltransferase [Flavobacterium columnare]RVU91832.1 glycosyltransferase [Flavobacterium columnare]SPE78552.1 putative glycosyl transferase [Flavobacterium columnare]
MNFSLIICTYKRKNALTSLLESVIKQSVYPNQIIIVDGSPDRETKETLLKNNYKNLIYYQVSEAERGLTKQRNFGITKVNKETDVVCFLDDDVILETNYFEEILNTYLVFPKALGVGGYITNEVKWEKSQKENIDLNYFYWDGFIRKEPSRFKFRKIFKLDTDSPPGYFPLFSHGRSLSFLPPSGKTYPVEQLMGGVSSFKKDLFEKIQFSTYFQGYGLYEDADFSIRASQLGELYCNTAARLEHHHAPSGRPNRFKYGKMIVRNGWYVWRVKNPNPKLIDRYKWHVIIGVLLIIRMTNILKGNKKKEAFQESLGRIWGWISIFAKKPQ